jgi:hypothetical protein
MPGYRAASLVADALLQACEQVLVDIPEHHPQKYARDHARQLKPVLYQLRELTAALAASRPAPERMLALGFISVDTAETHDVLRLSLRQALFGRDCLLFDRAMPAFVRLAFVELLTLFGARAEAALDASRAVVGSLEAAHVTAQRGLDLDPLRVVLRESAEAAPALLEALPYLTRWR